MAARTRYQAVRLYGEGYPEKEIEQITGCNRTSLMEWCRTYRVDHSQGLADKRVGGNRAKLAGCRSKNYRTRCINIRRKNDWVEKPARWLGNFGPWKIWLWWCESGMVLNTEAALRTVAYCACVALATKRPRRSSSLGVRPRSLILKNSSKKTDRCSSRCTRYRFPGWR